MKGHLEVLFQREGNNISNLNSFQALKMFENYLSVPDFIVIDLKLKEVEESLPNNKVGFLALDYIKSLNLKSQLYIYDSNSNYQRPLEEFSKYLFGIRYDKSQLSILHIGNKINFISQFQKNIENGFLLDLKEMQLLKSISQGMTIQDAGEAQGVTRNTANEYLKSIKHKLNAKSTSHAISIALKMNII